MNTAPLNVPDLHRSLQAARRKGARAARLMTFSRPLIEALAPVGQGGDQSIYDRAFEAEMVIKDATDAIGGTRGEALLIVFALKPGYLGMPLEQRRRAAASLLGIEADTFRRARHEQMLLWDLTMEIYRILAHAGT